MDQVAERPDVTFWPFPAIRAVRLMRRILRTGTTLLVAWYGAACSASVDPATLVPRTAAHDDQLPPTPGTCTTLASLTTLANGIFAPTLPEAGLAVHNLNTMQQQIDAGNISGAQTTAFGVVQMIVTEAKQGRLIGSSADATSLTNGTLCYAGLPITTTDPTNTWVVMPTDNPQVIVASTGLAGTALPGHVVSEPTVITFTVLPPPSGAAPLNTKLDVYPNYVEFAANSAGNAPLTQPVVVAVCPSSDIPTDVLARLRLGHQASGGFEVTPAADASFLVCPAVSGLRGLPAWIQKVASWVLPAPLYARARAAGGVGGTAGSFSPFAPVDVQVSLSGGVGGTAGVFLRGTYLDAASCSPQPEAPIGTPIDSTCRPGIKVQTHLGTVLANVPVTFAAGLDGSTIAPDLGGSCGSIFGGGFATTTNGNGKAGACWTMGPTPGTNSIVATASVGGDVPEGVSFSPGTITFNATANPPTRLVLTQQPAAGSTITAGATFPAMVNAVDHNGVTVVGWNGVVSLGLNQNGWSTGATSTSVTANRGVATFSSLAINTAATGYQLMAGATLNGVATSQAGTLFNVVAAPAAGLALVQGDNQSASSGSAVAVLPTAKVTDAFGNPVTGASIAWSVGSGVGAVQPAQSASGADGTATTAWTVGDGANTLTATLSRPGLADLTIVFHATGSVSVVTTMNICPPRAPGDPTSGLTGPLAALVPSPRAITASPIGLGAPATHLVPLTHCVTLQ